MTAPACPPAALLHQQAAWLAPLRSRLLRRVQVAQRQHILDLGAGYGSVTAELRTRGGGQVVALDLRAHALHSQPAAVCGTAPRLPFAAAAFDLVFCQFTLLWVAPLAAALAEIRRVLQPGGVLLAIEPDYGGMIEHPPAIATRSLWLAALRRAGANPLVARQLPALLAAQGLHLRVDLVPELLPPAPERFALLRGLPLTPTERFRLSQREYHAARLAASPWAQLAHLPLLCITASLPNAPHP